MKNFITLVTSVWFWFSLFFVSFILFPVGFTIFLFTVLFDRKRIILHYFSSCWARVVILLNPIWRMRVKGRDRIRKSENYIMVANHSSGTDILVLYQLFKPYKFVAKKSLFSYPFIGWNMWLNGYIPIERSKGRSKLQMMDKAAEAVRSGNSVLMFPEGTRTRDGKIQDFKTGSFRLALETRTAILPIAISGTFEAIQKGGLKVHKSRNILAQILEVIPYDFIKEMEPKEIAHLVQERIRKALESDPVVK